MIIARIWDSNGNMWWYPLLKVVECIQDVTTQRSLFQIQKTWRRQPNPHLCVRAVLVSRDVDMSFVWKNSLVGNDHRVRQVSVG